MAHCNQRNPYWIIQALACTAMFLFAAGCDKPSRGDLTIIRVDPRPLRFAVYPYLDREALQAGFGPLIDFLAQRVGCPVRLEIARNYNRMERLVQSGRVDIGMMTPRVPRSVIPAMTRVLALPEPVEGTSYRGLIITRSDSSIRSLNDLRGKRFAFVDRGSRSGFWAPNRILQAAGIQPPRDFASIHFAGSHDRCLDGVIRGDFDAAAVSQLVLDTDPASVKEVFVLARTDPIPLDPIVVSNQLDRELIQRLRDAFAEIAVKRSQDPLIHDLRQNLRIRGFLVPEVKESEGSVR